MSHQNVKSKMSHEHFSLKCLIKFLIKCLDKMSHQNEPSKCLITISHYNFSSNVITKWVLKMFHQNVSSNCLIKMSHQTVEHRSKRWKTVENQRKQKRKDNKKPVESG